MMKLMIVIGVLLISSFTTAEYCYNDVEAACGTTPVNGEGAEFKNCDAQYGEIELLLTDLQAYANTQIELSFEYLLMSIHFENFENNRGGFKKLFRHLSDEAWENGKNIIKFITKRGGIMNFNQPPRIKRNSRARRLELSEFQSLAKALDTQKKIAEEAMRIHNQAQHHAKQDASVAHYIEEEFLEKQADNIRQLAGFTSDMKALLTDHEPSLSVFMFDEYLKTIF